MFSIVNGCKVVIEGHEEFEVLCYEDICLETPLLCANSTTTLIISIINENTSDNYDETEGVLFEEGLNSLHDGHKFYLTMINKGWIRQWDRMEWLYPIVTCDEYMDIQLTSHEFDKPISLLFKNID